MAGISRTLGSERLLTAFDYAIRRVVYVFIIFIVVLVPLTIALNGISTGELWKVFALSLLYNMSSLSQFCGCNTPQRSLNCLLYAGDWAGALAFGLSVAVGLSPQVMSR